MSWTLIVWWAVAAPYLGPVAPPLLGLPGYATQQDCIMAGKSLPQSEFSFYCIPGPFDVNK
jgi:hypothetical protein